jgi:hypothetical protein
MLYGETLTSIFFRILNFGILIAFFTYICKRSIFPDAREHIAENDKQLHDLKHQRDSLKDTLKSLEQTFVEQEALSVILTKNVARWKEHSAKQQAIDRTLKDQHMQQLAHKTTIQSEHIHAQHVQKAVLPLVMNASEQQLREKFASNKESEKFLHSLLDYIKGHKQ